MSCMLRHRSFKSIRELHVLHNVDGINEQNASHRGMGENCYTMDMTLSMNRRKTIQRQHVSSKSSTKKKTQLAFYVENNPIMSNIYCRING